MFVITISFLNGAYHATPWGKHVNEGVPEWPPSIWRLIRAIIAIWKSIVPELPDESVWPILKKLAYVLPHYNIPDASLTHTRHYMPQKDKPTLIMDTRIVTGDKPIHIIWEGITLNTGELEILDRILKNLHYFGRAESWCRCSTSTDKHVHNCSPINEQGHPENSELVRILVPKPDVEFLDINKPKTGNTNLKAISITTNELQDSNYLDPPGGRWVWYYRPQNCFVGSRKQDTTTSHLNNITLVRYAVVGSVRPTIKDTLRVGDLARTACMSIYGKKMNKQTSGIFSGKDPQGKPLTNHIHASYLPTYETQNQEIDHLTIIAPGGFDKDELDVLFSLKKLYTYNSISMNLIFQGCGTPSNFSSIPILKKARSWVSATPLILTRHTKYRGKGSQKHEVDGPEEQIYNEIKRRYGEPYELKCVTIHDSQTNICKTAVKPFDFFRWRNHGSVGSSKAYKVQLEFKEPKSGPIALGYASHFGLGMFTPLGDN